MKAGGLMEVKKKFPCSIIESDYLEVTVYDDDSAYLYVKDANTLKGYAFPHVQSLRDAIKNGFHDNKVYIGPDGLNIDSATFFWDNDYGESVLAWLDSIGIEPEEVDYFDLVDLLVDNVEMISYFKLPSKEKTNLRELFARNLRAYGIGV